jgi:DNA-binding transcriptional ArsR family regulator
MKHSPLRDVLTVTKALSDTQRVRILMLLHDGELCVCQVVAVLRLATSTVSKHLSLLAAAGLVTARKDGRWAYYQLAAGQRAVRWMHNDLEHDEQIRADRVALGKIKKQSLEVLCRQQRPN